MTLPRFHIQERYYCLW